MNQLRQATAVVDAEMRSLQAQLRSAHQKLNSARHQRDLATNQGDIARAERASAVDALGAMRGERDAYRRAHTEATAKTSQLESRLHLFTAGKSWEERHLLSRSAQRLACAPKGRNYELETRLHATRRSLSEAVAKVAWLELRLGESAPDADPDATDDDATCLDYANDPSARARLPLGKRRRGAALKWPAQADLAWRLALEFSSPVAAGRVAVVCRAALRGATDELLWSVFASRAGISRSLTTKHVSGDALRSRATVVAACPDVDVADAVSGQVEATIAGGSFGRGSRRHYERARHAILGRVRDLEVELSHDGEPRWYTQISHDDDDTYVLVFDPDLYDLEGYWEDEREPLFRELHYLLEWLERQDRRAGRMDRALDWKTPVSPPENFHVRVADRNRHDMHNGSAWATYLKQLENRHGSLPMNEAGCRCTPCCPSSATPEMRGICDCAALETDLRWCAVVIHGDALYYDRLVLATPAIAPGDRVLALAPDTRSRSVCDGSVPPATCWRPAVVNALDATTGSYELTFDRSAPPSARIAYRDFVYGRVAVLTLHKFKGHVDDDSDDSNVESGWVKETYFYRSARRAIAACLEIAEADAHRCPPDEEEYLWIRYAPPTQSPLTKAEREAWEGLFDWIGESKAAQFAKMAFEAQLPLFWCQKRVADEATIISVEMRGCGEQIMTKHLVGAGTPNVRVTTIPMRVDQINLTGGGKLDGNGHGVVLNGVLIKAPGSGWTPAGPLLDARYDGSHFKADYVHKFPATWGNALVNVGNGAPPAQH